MKKNSDKKTLLEMMHKVGGMPLNENYPMGAEPEYAGDDAPYNQNDDDAGYEPDPDEGRDDDMSENVNQNPNVIGAQLSDPILQLIDNQISEELYMQISTNPDTFFKFYQDILKGVMNTVYEKYADSFNTNAGAAPDEIDAQNQIMDRNNNSMETGSYN